jgi:hypothetical protein
MGRESNIISRIVTLKLPHMTFSGDIGKYQRDVSMFLRSQLNFDW